MPMIQVTLTQLKQVSSQTLPLARHPATNPFFPLEQPFPYTLMANAGSFYETWLCMQDHICPAPEGTRETAKQRKS